VAFCFELSFIPQDYHHLLAHDLHPTRALGTRFGPPHIALFLFPLTVVFPFPSAGAEGDSLLAFHPFTFLPSDPRFVSCGGVATCMSVFVPLFFPILLYRRHPRAVHEALFHPCHRLPFFLRLSPFSSSSAT
jgi:hypothetical protein